MKKKIIASTSFLIAAVAVLAFAGCSKSKQESLADKTKDVYQDSKDAVKEAAHDTKAAVVRGWDNLTGYTYEKRSDFAAEVRAKQADLEAGLSKLRAEYSEANASASRKAAMAELKDSEADYKEKLSALGNASADTWASVRDNVAASWDRLQASYAKARAAN